jgi:hypothetical protein
LIFPSLPSSFNPTSKPFVRPSLAFAFLIIILRSLVHTCANLCKHLLDLRQAARQLAHTCVNLSRLASTCVYLGELAHPLRAYRELICLDRAALGLVSIAGYRSHTYRLDMTFVSPFELLSTPKHAFSARHLYRTSYPWLFLRGQR